MDDKIAIAKRFIEAHKNPHLKGIIASDENEFIEIYAQLMDGGFGTVNATGQGNELKVVINSFNSQSGSTQLFIFTPAWEDLKPRNTTEANAVACESAEESTETTKSLGSYAF